MNIKLSEIIEILAMIVMFFIMCLPLAQSACLDLQGSTDRELVKDCGDVVYIRGNITDEQRKQDTVMRNARNGHLQKLVDDEIARKHAIEIQKGMIEVQTRLAEAQAPKIYIGGSYASGSRTTVENNISQGLENILNTQMYQHQDQSLENTSRATNRTEVTK